MRTELRNPSDFYRQGGFDAATECGPMMRLVLEHYAKFKSHKSGPLDLLDVGCGANALFSQMVDPTDNYMGCDILESVSAPVEYVSADLNNQTLGEVVGDKKFDVIFCLELVEHLFSPDALVRDFNQALKPDGILILSTPNLAYWLNRLMLLTGLSPMLMENSSEVKLGRKFKFFGQGNSTEGHIRVFTYTAMIELLERCGFDLLASEGREVWNFPPDKLLARLSPRIAPDVAYVAKRSASTIDLSSSSK